MNIGKAATASGVSAKMIRYYESSGLLPAPERMSSGYRIYSNEDVHRLVFVRRARELGFSMANIEELLGLWSDRRRSNNDVRNVARKHVDDLHKQAERLQQMIQTLETLIGTCEKSGRPECPIMQELSGGTTPPVRCENANPLATRAKKRLSK